MLRPIFFVLALTALLPFDTYAKEITIQSGDTLSEIANRYRVSITTLKQINKIHNPNQLQVVGVPITTQSNYGGISSDMIMAGYASGGYDSCQGDSGGPMVVLADDGQTYMQVGVVSWGSGCAYYLARR